MARTMFDLTKQEFSLLKKLSTPAKIQDFLDTVAINCEKQGETCMSPRRVLRENRAHCIEGAMVAAAALWIRGEPPLLLDLKTMPCDYDHVVALYKLNGYWGAISKTNHSVLRYRDPIYRTVRELALSYFHEYVLNTTGQKTLLSYSIPFSLKRYGYTWVTAEEELWNVAHDIDVTRHFRIIPKKNARLIRKVGALEMKTGCLAEWTREDPRT